MKDIKVKPNISIRDAMRYLNHSGAKCLAVVDEKSVLLGTLSDGDLRKAILQGREVSDDITGIYEPHPAVLVEGQFSRSEAEKLFIDNKFDLIPVVNKKGNLIDVLFWDKFFKRRKISENSLQGVPVVVMAGGKGTRLEPFTQVLPKPLIPIHEKPVIEHVLERFTDFGADRFIISVNYKARILKAFFEEMDVGFSLEYLEEEDPLGTAGSLRFLKNRVHGPFFVTNCDILVKADYSDLLDFHRSNSYAITLVASTKNFTIPYGTCELNGDGHLKRIHEKPEYEFLVNTGLYVLDPGVLELIPHQGVFHLTQLVEATRRTDLKVGVYPIDDEAWVDVGQWAEYQKAVEQL